MSLGSPGTVELPLFNDPLRSRPDCKFASEWMMGRARYNSMKLSDASGEVFENGASEF